MSHPSLDRRTLIRTAGAVGVGAVGAGALAACGSSGSDGSSSAASSTTATTSDGASTSPDAAGGSSSSSAAPAGLSVAASSIPVGGGTVITDSAVVVTQPTAGTFKAFSAICTHQGCPVNKVENGKISCPCHGSLFDITTGEPTADSQAKRALGAKTATVSGANVVIS